MKRRMLFFIMALGISSLSVPDRSAQAQTLAIGRGGVRYDGYSQGYYGGNGRGNNGYYAGNNRYRGYGAGPYVYGSRSGRIVTPSYRRNYYGNRPVYNGYQYAAPSGYYGQSYGPFGSGPIISFGW